MNGGADCDFYGDKQSLVSVLYRSDAVNGPASRNEDGLCGDGQVRRDGRHDNRISKDIFDPGPG